MKRYLAGKQSLLIALGLAAGLALWLLSGMVSTGAAARDPAVEAPQPPRAEVDSVRVAVLESEPVTRDVVVYGRTEPARTVTLRAEIDGRVVALGPERGARVREGELIARLDIRDRKARLEGARAAVRQTKLQYEAAKRLESKSFQSETAVAEALANLEAARATVKLVEVEIANAEVRAPFDGVLQERPVEIGDFVTEGKEVARVLELDPVLVTGDVTQQELADITLGAPGRAKLLTGEEVEGVVSYIASEADRETRTFRIELEVPNPEAELVSGITAEIRIPTETLDAHFLSPALLSLDARDRVGVKTVNGDGVVEFHPVEIVRSAADGLWVTGLPPRARVITVGQGFVREGERVNAVDEPEGRVS